MDQPAFLVAAKHLFYFDIYFFYFRNFRNNTEFCFKYIYLHWTLIIRRKSEISVP